MDVAPVVRAKIQNGKLRITVSNQESGDDPVRDVPKKLEVTYSHDGTTYSKMVAEGETFSAP
jgi:hypothetical protein